MPHVSTPRSRAAGLLSLLALCLPSRAGQSPAIDVAGTRTPDGGSELDVRGPANARGLLIVGVERVATSRAWPGPGGLTLRLDVEPRAVIPFLTDGAGRYVHRSGLAPDGLLVQVVFPGATLGGASGGPSGVSRATPTVFCPLPVQPGDLVITEVQRDPAAVADVDGEWFELHNRSVCPIDLGGWRILDESGDSHVLGADPGVVVAPGGRIVLGRNGDPASNGGVPVDYVYDGFDLDDVADRIVLQDPAGLEFERVEWDATWPANQAGRALSLEPGTDAAGNDVPASWCLASAPIDPTVFVDFGTPGAPNPSCACSGELDLPDGAFVDANCDGIDGTVARAYFVAADGSAGAQGTPADPFDTLAEALDAAAADPLRDHVYVSVGIYDGLVVLRDGVSIWGGYDRADGWARSADHVVELTNAAPQGGLVIAMRGDALAQPIVVGDLDIRAADAGAGQSSFAVKLHAVADLTFERAALTSGRGGNGSHGANGSGLVGSTLSGGVGGSGGAPLSGGASGLPGIGPCGNPGQGGSYPGNGKNAGNGCVGMQGAPGSPASNHLPTLFGGTWAVSGSGGGPAGQGQPGGGGGGGGGGSGGFLVGTGGKGGNGGFGGRGGAGGLGAQGGGSSCVLVVSSSNVLVVDSALTCGDGGNGGIGGNGSQGQGGSGGANGAAGSGGYPGGKGGNGGHGGGGGKGGNAAGGNSITIVAGDLSTVQLLGAYSATYGAPGTASGAPGGLAGNVLVVDE